MVTISVGGVNAKDLLQRTPLYLASRHGYGDLVNELINAGADLDAKSSDGWTALHVALFYEHYNIVKDLIAAEANVNLTQDQSQWTPLHTACFNESIEIVRLLLEAGADVDAKDSDERTPLYYSNDQKIIELLNMYETIDIKEPDCL